MGCVNSSPASPCNLPNLDVSVEQSRFFDKVVCLNREMEPDRIDILLLGREGAGKSTLMKQLQLIFYSDYHIEERYHFKPYIYDNIVQNMSALLGIVEKLGKEKKWIVTCFVLPNYCTYKQV